MVLVVPHDPLPLLEQVEQRDPGEPTFRATVVIGFLGTLTALERAVGLPAGQGRWTGAAALETRRLGWRREDLAPPHDPSAQPVRASLVLGQ